MVSLARCSAAYCAINTLPSREIDLISQCSQRASGAVTAATPCSSAVSSGRFSGIVIIKTVGETFSGKACARGATPRVTRIYTRQWPVFSAELAEMISSTNIRQLDASNGFASWIFARLRAKRAKCCSKRKGRRCLPSSAAYTGITSYTPSPRMKPRSNTEMRALESGSHSPFRYTMDVSITRSVFFALLLKHEPYRIQQPAKQPGLRNIFQDNDRKTGDLLAIDHDFHYTGLLSA